MRLKDKVVIVTGSTTGIGEAIARRAVAEGARVLVHGLEQDLGEQVAGSLGDAAALHVDDLADPAAAARVVEAALGAFGRIDALVNNAARVHRSTIEDTDAATFDAVLAVNTRAPLLLIRAALDALESTRGAVLNIGSVNAHCGEPTFVAYSASKGALMTLTRNLGDTLHRERGVRVNQINPEWVLTEGEKRVQAQAGQPPRLAPEAPEGVGALGPPHPSRGDRRRRRVLDRRREPAHQRQRGGPRAVPGDRPQPSQGDPLDRTCRSSRRSPRPGCRSCAWTARCPSSSGSRWRPRWAWTGSSSTAAFWTCRGPRSGSATGASPGTTV